MFPAPGQVESKRIASAITKMTINSRDSLSHNDFCDNCARFKCCENMDASSPYEDCRTIIRAVNWNASSEAVRGPPLARSSAKAELTEGPQRRCKRPQGAFGCNARAYEVDETTRRKS